jgi:hypothetical protein
MNRNDESTSPIWSGLMDRQAIVVLDKTMEKIKKVSVLDD